jgi:hypothetical protein
MAELMMKEAAVVLVTIVDLSVAVVLVSTVVPSVWSYVRNRSQGWEGDHE